MVVGRWKKPWRYIPELVSLGIGSFMTYFLATRKREDSSLDIMTNLFWFSLIAEIGIAPHFNLLLGRVTNNLVTMGQVYTIKDKKEQERVWRTHLKEIL